MVENRSFDFPQPMMGWTSWSQPRLRDGIFVITNQSFENQSDPKYLSVTTQANDTVGLINQSFSWMSFKKEFRILTYTSLKAGNSWNTYPRALLPYAGTITKTKTIKEVGQQN